MDVLQDDRVYRFRAVRSTGIPVEDDPEPMVQQQYARLRFFEDHLGAGARRILDWGCGSGFNCKHLLEVDESREVAGFDVSAGAVELARRSYPGITFHVADACAPALDLGAGTWDRILSCEVLEHVPDMPQFLANIRRHLGPDGVAFVTTPNRLVFSLGHRPSPVNREHIEELDFEEYLHLLRPHFGSIEVFGQRFREARHLDAWKVDVQDKIAACQQGTRWQDKEPLRAKMRQWRAVEWGYRIPFLRTAWQAFRWRLLPGLKQAVRPARQLYRWSDFEFVKGNISDALWFCAVVRP